MDAVPCEIENGIFLFLQNEKGETPFILYLS